MGKNNLWLLVFLTTTCEPAAQKTDMSETVQASVLVESKGNISYMIPLDWLKELDLTSLKKPSLLMCL